MSNKNPITYYNRMENAYYGVQPSDVKGRANESVRYWKRYLYQKLYSVFQFTIPEEWDMNYFLFYLFTVGSTAVGYTKEYGWINQPYTVTKFNIYYNPREFVMTSPFIATPKRCIIGVNGGIIHVMPDYRGLDDVVTRYAYKLASCDKAIDINLMNCNVALLYRAQDKKEADSMKEAFGKATSGEPLITISDKLLGNGQQLDTLINNVGGNFIAPDVLQLQNSIMNQFLTTVGIRNANYDKKERLNSAEVNENNDDTRSIISVIYETIKHDMDVINKLSGLNLGIQYRYNYESEGSEEDAQIDAIRNV